MAEIEYTGDAPAFAQEERYFFTGTPGEGASLLVTIGRKTLRAQSDTVREGTDDEDVLEDLIDSIIAEWEATTMPEFVEIDVDKGYNALGTPYLQLTSKLSGRPFTCTLSNPAPTVDIDTLTDGVGPLPEIQTYYLDPTPTGGTYRVLWNLGSGLETSGAIDFDADADAVKAALVTGMASITPYNLTVTGAGTEGNPFVLTLGDDLEETAVSPLTIDGSNLTGNGEVVISTVTEGGSASAGANVVTDAMTDANGTTLASHVATGTAQSWLRLNGGSLFTGAALTIQNNKIQTNGVDNDHVAYIIDDTFDNRVIITADVSFNGSISTLGLLAVLSRSGTTLDQSIIGQVAFGDKLKIRGNIGNNMTGVLAEGEYEYDDSSETIQLRMEITATHIIVSTQYEQISYPVQTTELGTGEFGVYTRETGQGTIDNFLVNEITLADEVQSVYHNGDGGSFDLTFGGQTATIPSGSSATDVDTLLTALSSINACTVTGLGSITDPYLVTFTGTHSGLNVAQMTGDGADLTGGFDGVVETTQEGGVGTDEIQRIVFSATGGTLLYSFGGFTTAAIAYNASTATLQAALEGLASIGSGNVAVSGSAGAYILTFQGDLAATDVEQVSVDTTSLTGSASIVITKVTVQASKGPKHWDDPLNWRNVATGAAGVPATGDTVFIERGDQVRSLLYGLDQNAVSLDGLYINSKFESNAWIGLPQYSSGGYCEYRDTHLKIGFQGSKVLVVGEGNGSGASRINIDADGTAVDIRVLRTAGQESDAHTAMHVKNTHANSTLKMLGPGSIGLALHPGDAAPIASIQQTSGTIIAGEGATIGAGSGRVIDRTGGNFIQRDCVINGDVYGV